MHSVFRKEIKYIVPIEQYLMIEKTLSAMMKLDKYGTAGVYKVRSQYYDSITNQDLMDNLMGVMEKRKIRLRIYSPEDKTVKLEYKCKSGTEGKKYSLNITRAEALMMEQRRYDFLLYNLEPLAVELYYKMLRGVYQPKTIVEYERKAYIYPVSDVRITFDTNLVASSAPLGLFDKKPFYQPILEQDVGVLEVKYNDFIPSPLKKVIEQMDQLPQASSKYSKARLLHF